VKQFQIFTSQSQKNIKSNLTPGKKIETKSRPNTGGTKSPFKQNIRPLSYKDKFSLSSNQGKPVNEKQNDSNISLNISGMKSIRTNDKQSLSSNRSGFKSAIPNISKIQNNKNFLNNNVYKMGPNSTREATKNAILNNSKAKLGILNDSRTLNNSNLLNNSAINNSISDTLNVNHTRSKSQNLQNKNDKSSKMNLNSKNTSYSKSPNRNPFLAKNNIKEKTPRDDKKRTASPILASSYMKKFNPGAKVPNFSKISTGNLLNDRKFKDEQIEVQVTNNLKPKNVGNFSLPKKPTNSIIGNLNTITRKVDAQESDVNKGKTVDNQSKDNLTKEVDLRKITTSPIVIKKPGNAKNDPKNNLPTPNISTVNKDNLSNKDHLSNSVTNNSNATTENKAIIKTIKKMHDITKKGYSGEGVKKINQDNFFIYKNFNNNPNSIYFGVCDGHGVVGHEVSAFLRENLPITLDSELKKRLKNGNMNKIIEEIFVGTNYRLCNETGIDTHFSGSTCVTLIYTPEKLLCANAGDSRAVLGRCVNGAWASHDLSRDHKPSEKDEAERIIKRRGRIEPFRDENNEFIGPARVWLKEDDIPGLAMSRSFGDQVAASVGVIAEPEISEWKFTKDDMFFIIASDGIWEFIESDECVNIIKPYYLNNDIEGAAEYLVKESTRRWLKEEEVIDDITLILVFLN